MLHLLILLVGLAQETQTPVKPAGDEMTPEARLEESGSESRPPLTGPPAQRCRHALAQRRYADAVEACRTAVAADPSDTGLLRTAARVELNADNADNAVELWEQVLKIEGWSREASHSRAMALWRAGRTDEAERVLTANVRRSPGGTAAVDLLRFLVRHGRYREACRVAVDQQRHEPVHCELHELHGVAEAARGRHGAAAAFFERAVEDGCPPFRWTTLGPMPRFLKAPAYSNLLAPERLIDGLDDVPQTEAIHRLQLLRPTTDPLVVDAVVRQALERELARVRLAAIGWIERLGDPSLDAWAELLKPEDLILRKQVLRRIRELHDPRFIPLLETTLDRDLTRGNRSLASMALGELLAAQGALKRAEQLFESVPPEDPLYVKSRLLLADLARDAGRLEDELRYLETAAEFAPEDFLEQDRLDAVRDQIDKGRAAPQSADGSGKR